MKLASSNAQQDFLQAHALLLVRARARELTANLLRVVRGAGKPYGILRDAAELVRASQDFKASFGFWPHDEISDAIRFDQLEDGAGMDEAERRIQSGRAATIRGALQIVASDMLGQEAQSATGKFEFYSGVGSILEGQDLQRENSQADESNRPRGDRPRPRPGRKPRTRAAD